MLFAPGSPELQIYREYANRLGHTLPVSSCPVRSLEELADQIREELAAKGIVLMDNKDGTTSWEVAR